MTGPAAARFDERARSGERAHRRSRGRRPGVESPGMGFPSPGRRTGVAVDTFTTEYCASK